jgi:hypothetical protein
MMARRYSLSTVRERTRYFAINVNLHPTDPVKQHNPRKAKSIVQVRIEPSPQQFVMNYVLIHQTIRQIFVLKFDRQRNTFTRLADDV